MVEDTKTKDTANMPIRSIIHRSRSWSGDKDTKTLDHCPWHHDHDLVI